MKINWLAFLATVAASAGTVSAQATSGESRLPMRTHSLYMPYIDQELQNRWFDFGGDAVINTNKHIALTLDRPSQSGHIWSKTPISAENWQIEFQFQVGDEKASKRVYGDGMALWLTKDRKEPGPVFGNKDKWEGLGIIFDTFPNGKQTHSFPYVMAMLGDGRTSYDGANDGKRNEIAGCEADFRAKGHPTKARVKYYQSQRLELHLQYKDTQNWDVCFVVDKAVLPSSPFLGITASTGAASDLQGIVSITGSTIVLDKIPEPTLKAVPKKPMPEVIASWGFIGTITRLIGLGAVLGVAFVVFRMYQKDAKRF